MGLIEDLDGKSPREQARIRAQYAARYVGPRSFSPKPGLVIRMVDGPFYDDTRWAAGCVRVTVEFLDHGDVVEIGDGIYEFVNPSLMLGIAVDLEGAFRKDLADAVLGQARAHGWVESS